MDLKTIYTNMIMAALLIFALMSFALIFQNDNDATEKLMDNALINDTYNDLYGNLSANQQETQTTSDVFGNFTPNENLGVWEVTPIVSPTRGFKTLTVGFYNIMVKLPMQVMGVSPIVASVISGILIFILIIGVWGIWKGVFKI
jgi:hypothetical protein